MVVRLMNSTTGTRLNRFQMIMTGVNKTSKVILEVTNFSLTKETPIQKLSLLFSFIVRGNLVPRACVTLIQRNGKRTLWKNQNRNHKILDPV